MSYFAVSKWQDTIKVKEKKEVFGAGQLEYYTYFDLEWQARRFIRERAEKALTDAEKAVRSAKARVRKCNKKFPYILGEGSGMEFMLRAGESNSK